MSCPVKWHVYILKCNDGRFYTGITNNLERRFEEHKTGKGAHFTKVFGVEKLLYNEDQPSRSEAMKREAQIKSWTKAQKLALISGRKASQKN